MQENEEDSKGALNAASEQDVGQNKSNDATNEVRRQSFGHKSPHWQQHLHLGAVSYGIIDQ